jgi:hypothetical protein
VKIRYLSLIFVVTAAVGLPSCMSAYKKSVGGDIDQDYSRIYLTDMNTAWQSALEALKSVPLETANRESGLIQTKWVDNTADKNFTESFGAGEYYLKAQMRFVVQVSPGFYAGRPSVKINVKKEQLVQFDVLEGFRPVPTSGLEENTFLYRVERVVWLLQKFAKLEEEKARKAIEKKF